MKVFIQIIKDLWFAMSTILSKGYWNHTKDALKFARDNEIRRTEQLGNMDKLKKNVENMIEHNSKYSPELKGQVTEFFVKIPEDNVTNYREYVTSSLFGSDIVSVIYPDVEVLLDGDPETGKIYYKVQFNIGKVV